MKITFFGVRGSIPSPGPLTMIYGGNTPSVLIETDGQSFFIIDAGSGIRRIGQYLIRKNYPIKEINILFTHTHWDHIMGLPFFKPIYDKNTKIIIWGPSSNGTKSLKEIITGQMVKEYFPVNSEELEATFEANELKDRENFRLNGCEIHTCALNHPVKTLGYRISFKGKIISTCWDHEMYTKKNCTAPVENNEKIFNFLKKSDLIIHDAQYLKSEYEKEYNGWGHSTFEFILQNLNKFSSANIALFHHEPSRTDKQLKTIESFCKNYAQKNYRATNIFVAKESFSITI